MDTTYLPWAIAGGVIVGFWAVKRMGQVQPSEARKLVEAGAVLVDVRTIAEFSGGHLPNAINAPLSELAAHVEKFGEKKKPLVVYCASGTRSAMAKLTLKKLGFEQVYDLGPMGRWR